MFDSNETLSFSRVTVAITGPERLMFHLKTPASPAPVHGMVIGDYSGHWLSVGPREWKTTTGRRHPVYSMGRESGKQRRDVATMSCASRKQRRDGDQHLLSD